MNEWQSQRDSIQARLPQRLMMIDIGGGTLDVSLLELRREGEGLVADIQGRSRYNELAGDDFDLQIAGLLLARYEAERPRVEDAQRDARRTLFYEMLLRAEEAKKQLFPGSRWQIPLGVWPHPRAGHLELHA